MCEWCKILYFYALKEQANGMSMNIIWYGNSLFDTTYKYTHLNILHN